MEQYDYYMWGNLAFYTNWNKYAQIMKVHKNHIRGWTENQFLVQQKVFTLSFYVICGKTGLFITEADFINFRLTR